MNDLMTDTEVRISSVEIARRTDKQHKIVLRDIRMMFTTLDTDTAPYEGTYVSEQGKELPCFYLNRYYALILTTGYDTKLRSIVIAFFEQHNQRLDAPTRKLRPKNQAIYDLLLQIDALEDRVDNTEEELATVKASLGHHENYMPIKAYININKIHLPIRSTGPLGKVCTKFCKEMGINTGTAPDERFGEVKTYPVDVIKEAVDKLLSKLKENKEK